MDELFRLVAKGKVMADTKLQQELFRRIVVQFSMPGSRKVSSSLRVMGCLLLLYMHGATTWLINFAKEACVISLEKSFDSSAKLLVSFPFLRRSIGRLQQSFNYIDCESTLHIHQGEMKLYPAEIDLQKIVGSHAWSAEVITSSF